MITRDGEVRKNRIDVRLAVNYGADMNTASVLYPSALCAMRSAWLSSPHAL